MEYYLFALFVGLAVAYFDLHRRFDHLCNKVDSIANVVVPKE